ncbi:SAM-dependent MidA family methyltransferase [Methylohalomonas lacus]|uniref:SAM-dependent MidA family methyltransferase n=1 Tax=Methylohalomonas lacus TaxID=398773 RepID=A0AAE3HMR0_9GAMM|nr:SAM-dependent MidA family methyltransferase [Methylohalomonas lacus]
MPLSVQSRTSVESLPEPDATAAAHSDAVRVHIAAAIDEAGGIISFADYMTQALYAPGLGYYSAGAAKLGAAGDFVTAPEISTLFGRCIARQCEEVLATLAGGAILELGAGSGRLAVDVLGELASRECLPECYYILEVSADLRERQQRLIAEQLPQLVDRVQWLEQLPAEPLQGIVLANEVLDALPVECVQLDDTAHVELGVTHDDGVFRWQSRSPGAQLHAALARLLVELPETPAPPYRTEINTGLEDWLRAVAGVLDRGVMLFIDYGYPRAEYYHPQRNAGSLICHYRHRAHEDPFLYPGLQDISASVDFTRLAEAAQACDLEVAGFTSQAHFLLGCGLDNMLAAAADQSQQDYWRLTGEVKRLTLPGEMGERFKAMALVRDYDGPLAGFRLQDFRHRL